MLILFVFRDQQWGESGSYPAVAGRMFTPEADKRIIHPLQDSPRRHMGFFMYTVYVLHSKRYDKIYIGFTTDLKARLRSHNELATKGWTIRYRPWEVVHTEEYEIKSEAMRRERALKSHGGRDFIREMIGKE